MVFARLGPSGTVPLPVGGLFTEDGELVGPPIAFRFDPGAWAPHANAVGGAVPERLSTLSRAAARLAPGAPLAPAPGASFAVAVESGIVRVNPDYLALLDMSPIPLPTAAVIELTPFPDRGLGACVQRMVDRCRDCLTSGGCDPIVPTFGSGAEECAALAAQGGRGFRLLCAGALYPAVRACLQGGAPDAGAGDAGASSDAGSTPPACAPVDSAGLQGLEAFAPLVDDPTCAQRIDACLMPPPTPGSRQTEDVSCGSAPNCRDRCGDDCTLSREPLDTTCALPCEFCGRMFETANIDIDDDGRSGAKGSDGCACGDLESVPAPRRAEAGAPPPPPMQPADESSCGCGGTEDDPAGTGGSRGMAGAGGSGAGGMSGAGGLQGMAGTGGGSGGSRGSAGSGGSPSGGGGSAGGCGKGSDACNGCDGCSRGSDGGGCSSCTIGGAHRRSRYAPAEPLLAVLLPLAALAFSGRRRR